MMVHKLKHFGWLHTKDMCANNLFRNSCLPPRSLSNCSPLSAVADAAAHCCAHGHKLTTVDSAIVRKNESRKTQFDRTDLLKMD